MQSVSLPLVVEQQLTSPGAPNGQPSLQPQLKLQEMKEVAENSDAVFAIGAFAHTVERLERLLDQETAALLEHKLVALDEFNQKKSRGLLELRRTIDAICGLKYERTGLDPKPILARLRGKLQNNLLVLQTHLNAVAAIAAIIARTIEEQESDGTYTLEDSCKSAQR